MWPRLEAGAASRPAETWGVWGVTAVAAIAAALAGCHPTRTPVVDPVYSAALASVVTLAAARAGRATLLWLAVVAAVMSRGPVVLPAAAGLSLAFAVVLPRRPYRLLAALSAALSIQIVLRWTHQGFQGETALVAVVAVLPLVVHTVILLSRRGRFWFTVVLGGIVAVAAALSVPIVVETVLASGQVSRGISATDSALKSVSAGDATGATQKLTAATADFTSADRRLGSWWTVGARLVPVVAEQRQALVGGGQLARGVTSVAGQEASQIDFEQLHYQGGRVDLAKVAALEGPLKVVSAKLTGGLQQLSGLRSGWIVEPLQSRLDKLGTELQKASDNASLAEEAVAAAPALLGADGPRHYFVLFMDTSEGRGLGGVMANYGELTATNGVIKAGQFDDIFQFNDALARNGGGHLSGPASYLARYGSFQPQSHVQDITYAPDLPTVSQVAAQLFSQIGGGPIDGTLVLDPKSLASLLGYTGPIFVPGLGQLTATNAEGILEKTEYSVYSSPDPVTQTARRAALKTALKTAIDRLSGGSLPGPRDLASALGPDVRTGDLLFWSNHPAEEPLLARLGLSGQFPQNPGGDLLSVVTQNSDNNKIDVYLHRTIADQVSYNPSTGEVSSTVTVTLHNSAPTSGESPLLIDSYAGSGVAPGANRIWMSVYSPLGLTAATVGGAPLALTTTPELGVEAYSGYMTVDSGATVTVTVSLHGGVASGANYGLALYEQPMVNPDHLSVSVTSTHGGSTRSSTTVAPRLSTFLNFRF